MKGSLAGPVLAGIRMKKLVWLEFLLTIVLFVGLLSGLVDGVITSWRF
jgi:hypothetical protein